jgi:hypothetical protein
MPLIQRIVTILYVQSPSHYISYVSRKKALVLASRLNNIDRLLIRKFGRPELHVNSGKFIAKLLLTIFLFFFIVC